MRYFPTLIRRVIGMIIDNAQGTTKSLRDFICIKRITGVSIMTRRVMSWYLFARVGTTPLFRNALISALVGGWCPSTCS